jgi:hypothetical protein
LKLKKWANLYKPKARYVKFLFTAPVHRALFLHHLSLLLLAFLQTMAPRTWASAQQQTWLLARLAEFIKRQAEGKLHLFWAPMHEAWFKVFPEHTHLNLPLPNTKDARQLTPDELTVLGAAILARKGVSTMLFTCLMRRN